MGLAKYALVFGLGWAAGTPAGRKRLRALPAQLSALARRPEAAQLRERSKAAAGQAARVAKDRLGSGSTPSSTSTDADAAMHGTLPPTDRTGTPR